MKDLNPDEHANYFHLMEAIVIDFHFAFKQEGGVDGSYDKAPYLTMGDYIALSGSTVRGLGGKFLAIFPI